MIDQDRCKDIVCQSEYCLNTGCIPQSEDILRTIRSSILVIGSKRSIIDNVLACSTRQPGAYALHVSVFPRLIQR
jgi:hypothetical protein